MTDNNTLNLTLDELLTTTRAVRKRLDYERPVSRDTIETCLDLALQAPNGSNQQNWRWLVIDEPALKAKVADIYREGMAAQVADMGIRQNVDYSAPDQARIAESVEDLRTNMHRVPAIVIPVIRGQVEGQKLFAQASLWGSILPAVWNFMLALRTRGLGSAWTTVHLHRAAEMAELLGIPHEKTTQVGLFPVAYTIGTDFRRAPRKPAAEVTGWNGW